MNNIPFGFCECGCGQKTPLAKSTRKKKGIVGGQPIRRLTGHYKRRKVIQDVKERFWSKVDIRGENECWLWKAGRAQSPIGYDYGRFKIGGRAGNNVFAHRYSFFLAHGYIPQDLEVLHTCDNPPCVNPNHLVVGTHYQNMRDMVSKGRRKRKVTDQQVSEILALVDRGMTQSQIAKQFGLDQSTISNFVTGKRRS